MESKKSFLNDLEPSPAEKYISTANQETAETKETPKVEQPTIDQKFKPIGNRNKKDPNTLRGQRFSLLLTIPQREKLERLALVTGVSMNELIGMFIDEGLEKNKDTLEKYEKLKEVLGL